MCLPLHLQIFMYPDFHYLFQSLFGIDLPVLSLLKTFGFFVAMAFVVAYRVLYVELRRKARQGLFQPEISQVVIGEAPQQRDWLGSGILGFVMGYKIVGLLLNFAEVSADPLAYVLSLRGNLLGGIGFGLLMGYMTYLEKKKAQLPKPQKKEVRIYPHDRMMNVVLIAAVAGFAGAKIFNALETWDSFIANPIESLFSSGGFTFYGGLICAFVALFFFARKHKFSFKQLCDAAAPALMIAYAVGRLGCHFSGDGDWGIYNSAYLSQPDATLQIQVDAAAFDSFVNVQPELFPELRGFGEAPNMYVEAPSFLPRWSVAMNYAHNVNREGFVIEGDTGTYNTVLPAAVFPTPIYEFVVCSILFLVLMAVRRRWDVPLRLFGLYLVFNGLERFFVEKIRVNHKYEGFFNLTQAEIISFVLIVIGLVLMFRKAKAAPGANDGDATLEAAEV